MSLQRVDCSAETDGDEQQLIRCADVELEFCSAIGRLSFAQSLFASAFDKILHSRPTLSGLGPLDAEGAFSILPALSPKRREDTVPGVHHLLLFGMTSNLTFCRSAGDLMIRDFHLPNALVSIVLDPSNNEQRMILLSDTASTWVSMKCKCLAGTLSTNHVIEIKAVPLAFFDHILQNGFPTTNFNYPAFFVQVGRDSTTVIEQSAGITCLLPTTKKSELFC